MLRKHATMAILESQDHKGHMTTLQKSAVRANFEYTPEEGYIYVRSRMISSRCNDNFDEFPAEEIKKAYKTFIGKPVFVNHQNSDHRRARGVIVDAALHEHVNPDGSPDVWVEGLMAIDAVTYPKLAKAVLNGEIDKTSMGTDVAFSKCSACGNKATSPSEYCVHIPAMKGKKYFRHTAAGQKVGEIIREICYGLGFFENSLLVEEPADPTALFLGVDARGLGKAAKKDQRFEGTSLKQDDKGWYVATHRARSDSYESPDSIPDKDVEFIRSTGAAVPEKDTSPHERIPVLRDVMDADRYHGVSLREDNTGYYVRTPHGRSESYDSPESIPDDQISHVRSLHHESLLKSAAPREDGSTPPTIRDLPRKDQVTSPTGVDTLRDEDCPVCGNSDFFVGDRCQVCGFILPPSEFNDPDLTKHRQMKMVDSDSIREDGQVADVTEDGEISDGEDALADPDQLDENGELLQDDELEDMLECPECGFQIKATDPTTENTEEEPATLSLGDICPNCEEAELVSAGDLDEELEYEEDEPGEFDDQDDGPEFDDEEESDDNEESEDDDFDDNDDDPDEQDPVQNGQNDPKRQKSN